MERGKSYNYHMGTNCLLMTNKSARKVFSSSSLFTTHNPPINLVDIMPSEDFIDTPSTIFEYKALIKVEIQLIP